MHLTRRGVTDHPPGKKVDDDGQIHRSLPRGYLGDVSNPDFVGSRRTEATV
jgi:hypothetical protein